VLGSEDLDEAPVGEADLAEEGGAGDGEGAPGVGAGEGGGADHLFGEEAEEGARAPRADEGDAGAEGRGGGAVAEASAEVDDGDDRAPEVAEAGEPGGGVVDGAEVDARDDLEHVDRGEGIGLLVRLEEHDEHGSLRGNPATL
jgi:hypothetical protein